LGIADCADCRLSIEIDDCRLSIQSTIRNLNRQSAISIVNPQSQSSIRNRYNPQSAFSNQHFHKLLFRNLHRISPSIHLNGVTPVL
jgi:hypothetical protein